MRSYIFRKKNLKSLDLQKIHKNKLEFVFDGDESKQTDTWCVIHVNKDYLISGWNSKASGIKSKQTTQVKVWKADDVYPPSSLLIIPPKFKENIDMKCQKAAIRDTLKPDLRSSEAVCLSP